MSVQRHFHSPCSVLPSATFASVVASQKLKLNCVAAASPRARMNPRRGAVRENPMTLRRSTELCVV